MKEERRMSESFIRYALDVGALECFSGGRTLKSGRTSPYFFDAGRFVTGESLGVLLLAYADALYPILYKDHLPVLFGPAYKGTFLVSALALTIWQEYSMNIAFASNRKEIKNHGEGGVMIGAPLNNREVWIVDDVISDGMSKREAARIISAQGGTLAGCVVAFDRQERGVETHLSAAQQFEQEYGVPLIAAATAGDLVTVLRSERGHQEELLAILAYQEQYGIS